MYSKLGGYLGVTAKLGPLARTDLWAGVKGLLERLMTHLGSSSSLEEPWGAYWGVQWWGCLPRRWCWPLGKTGLTCAWGAPIALPNWPGRIIALPCLGGVRALRWSSLGPIASFPWGKENISLGRARNIKESIYIRVNNPSLNNNIGKFNLSHIWDRVLLNTKGLTLK